MEDSGLRNRAPASAVTVSTANLSPEDEAFIAQHGRLRRPVNHVAFDPFRRTHDGKLTWRDHGKAVLGLIFIPLRVALAVVLMGIPYVLVVLFGPPMRDIDSPNEEIVDLSAWRRKICDFAMRFCGRGLLLCMGFWRVHGKNHPDFVSLG
jgi:hypothetical protein